MIPRNTPLKRSSRLQRHTRLKAFNADARKKRQSRKPKLKAAVRKAVLERDGHQCAYVAQPGVFVGGVALKYAIRCPETEGLHVHHKTYARMGSENPDDLTTLCKWHHMRLHALEGKRINRP